MLDVVTVLERVQEILDSPDKWTKGANARCVTGEATQATDPGAVQWCIRGAVAKAVNELTGGHPFPRPVITYLPSVKCGCLACTPDQPNAMRIFQSVLNCLAMCVPGREGVPSDPVSFNDGNATYEDIQLMLKRAIYDLK